MRVLSFRRGYFIRHSNWPRRLKPSFYPPLRFVFSEVFDLKPTSILIWFWGRSDYVEQERPDDLRAAEHRRTPKRKREFCARNGGYVVECGGAPPLFKDVLGDKACLVLRVTSDK